MRQTAIFLILIGAVLRLRACVVFGGGVQAVTFELGEPEDASLKKFGLVARALQEFNQSMDLSLWVLLAGVSLLFGPMLASVLRGGRSTRGLRQTRLSRGRRHH